MNGIGKLFLTGLDGLELSNREAQFIKDHELGGVILFSKNYENKEQLKELTNSLKKINPRILIAVDHEGGRVQRFRDGFTQFPAMMQIADLGSPKLCFDVHAQMAMELRACGVNVNLGPCSDIFIDKDCSVIGDRSFGDNEKIVADFVSSAVRGLHLGNIMSCVKHFPGHGNTSVDSHLDLPLIKDSLETIIDRDLIPFKKGVKSKSNMVMMAHLKIPSLDENNITTVSETAYAFLRNQLKFNGIIITDDMEMGAIEKEYDAHEASSLAIKSGATIVEYRSFEKTKHVVEILSKDNSLFDFVDLNVDIIETQKNKFMNKNEPLIEEEVFENGQKILEEIERSLLA